MNSICPNCALCSNTECKNRRLSPISAVSDYSAGISAADSKKSVVAIDIGTTTVVFAFFKDGKIKETFSAVNPQRLIGADVISRIHAASSGKSALLRRQITELVKRGVYAVTGGTTLDMTVISANAVMVHLLMGWDVSGLGQYPFTTVSLDFVRSDLQAIAGYPEKIDTVILPGISAFVGGDIVSGLYLCGFDRLEKPSLFMDLGTNGETALLCGNKIYTASAAAGPAFEGGKISCGTGAVDGAVCGVKIARSDKYDKKSATNAFVHDSGEYTTEVITIGGKPPTGLCGTGITELTAELLAGGIIDETGLMRSEYFENGFPVTKNIRFTQNDVREVQLAKGAVRASCDTLLKHTGLSWDDLENIYLAGGFSYYMDMEKGARIGLFPKSCIGRIKTVGNTSLGGALTFASDKNAETHIKAIIDRAQTIELAGTTEFNELFIQEMNFNI